MEEAVLYVLGVNEEHTSFDLTFDKVTGTEDELGNRFVLGDGTGYAINKPVIIDDVCYYLTYAEGDVRSILTDALKEHFESKVALYDNLRKMLQ